MGDRMRMKLVRMFSDRQNRSGLPDTNFLCSLNEGVEMWVESDNCFNFLKVNLFGML